MSMWADRMMVRKRAISLGAFACGAAVVLAACGSDHPMASAEDAFQMLHCGPGTVLVADECLPSTNPMADASSDASGVDAPPADARVDAPVDARVDAPVADSGIDAPLVDDGDD